MVSTLCLVLLLGGGAAFAASKLPKNSVGTKQLRKNAVTRAKIRKSAVDGSKVANHSLRAVDFKKGQLPAGPQGDRGPVGPPGPSGATSVVMRTGAPFVAYKHNSQEGTAACDPGERATGGGVYPNDGVTPTGWRVWVANPDEIATETVEATPYVICVAP